MKQENITQLITTLLLLGGLIAFYKIASARMPAGTDGSIGFILPRKVYVMLKYLTSSIYIICIGVTALACAMILRERKKIRR